MGLKPQNLAWQIATYLDLELVHEINRLDQNEYNVFAQILSTLLETREEQER